MVSQDDPFFQELLQTFKSEALEHIQNLNEEFLDLEKKGEDSAPKECLQNIYRLAHSLKGAARSVGLDLIENVCQIFENLLSDLKEGKIRLGADLYSVVFKTLDYIKELISDPLNPSANPTEYEEIIASLHAVSKLESSETSPPLEAVGKPPPPTPVQEKKEKKSDANHRYFKISSHKLDDLIVEIEELLQIKIVYSQLVGQIETLMSAVKQRDAVDQKMSNLQHFVTYKLNATDEESEELKQKVTGVLSDFNHFFECIAVMLDKLFVKSGQDMRIVETTISHVQKTSKQFLMQPCATLLEGFPRMVRDISKQLNKEVNLEIEGEGVEVDRRILSDLKDPLMHLVRNSIDHGIEEPQERERLGKSREGNIEIKISSIGGNQIDLSVSDDGAGFSLEKIREKAISTGVINPETASSMEESDLLQLAFLPGFSTAELITELSGRGVGLDVLSYKLDRMGGKYHVESKPGQGTTFSISFPLTRAVFKGVLITCHHEQFIVPSKSIAQVLHKGRYELSTIENQTVISLKDKNYLFYPLQELLGLPGIDKAEPDIVMLLFSGKQDLAVGIDHLQGESEIIVKGLGSQLQHVRHISAGTILEGEKIIPILDVTDLIQTAQTGGGRRITAVQEEPVAEACSVILIAEDTMTTRLLFKNILEGAGYKVLTASDGEEAYQILASREVDLLITDLEMPKMTGFELVEKLKGEERTSHLPIVIISARSSTEDKKRGIALGVDAYIEKSTFVQRELLSLIKGLV